MKKSKSKLEKISKPKSTGLDFSVNCIFQMSPDDAPSSLNKYHFTFLSHPIPSLPAQLLLFVSSGTLQVTNIIKRQLFATYTRDDDNFMSIAASHYDDKLFISIGSVSGVLYLINLDDNSCFEEIYLHTKNIRQLLIHPLQPNWLASIGDDDYFKLTDISYDNSKFKRPEDRCILQVKTSGKLRTMVFTNDGGWALTGSNKGVRAWEIDIKGLSKNIVLRSKLRSPFSAQIRSKQFHQNTTESMAFLSNEVIASKAENENWILIWKFDVDAEYWHNSRDSIIAEPDILMKIDCNPLDNFTFSPSSCHILIGDVRGIITSYKLSIKQLFADDGEEEHIVEVISKQEIEGPGFPISGMLVASNTLATGSSERNCIILWSTLN